MTTLRFVRVWLPAIVTGAGVLVMVLGGFDDVALEGGAGIIGAGLSIWLLNLLVRVGLHDDRDRDAEDAARDFLDAHGHWPDEPPPPRATSSPPPPPSRTDSSATTSSPPPPPPRTNSSPTAGQAPEPQPRPASPRRGHERSRFGPRRPG